MSKLSQSVGDSWVPFSHEPVYAIARLNERERVIGGIPACDPSPFAQLVSCMEPPYFLLYVLHTPRGEGEAGRYQSPPVSLAQFHEFMNKFGAYLSSDARFDIWAHSAAENATIVWDRHDQLFAYGPLDRFASRLKALGFTQGESDISFAHQHHYRSEFDADAKALLDWIEWSHSPLRPDDEQ